jgi:hypothetical protein
MSRPSPFVLKTVNPTVAPDGERSMFVEPFKNLSGAVEWFQSKILVGSQITGAENGLYRWLLREKGLVAIPVESQQEIGSLHVNLWSWTPTLGQVIAAGELKKRGTRVYYNFLSGSFVHDYLNTEEKRKQLVAYVNKQFRSLNLTPIFLKCNPDGVVDCRDLYERYAGKNIIANAKLITPESELFWYRKFFTEVSLDTGNSIDNITEQFKEFLNNAKS